MIQPHKPKYHALYFQIAQAAAQQSTATREKVGAVVVTQSGMLSIGFNGMPSGFNNTCETHSIWDVELQAIRLKTNPEVIHAERNAIDKMTRQGISTEGSILFTTLSPCFECSKSLMGLGFTHIYYARLHDCSKGLALLHRAGIPTTQYFLA